MELAIFGGLVYLLYLAKQKEREKDARSQANRERLQAYYHKSAVEKAAKRQFNTNVYNSRSGLN